MTAGSGETTPFQKAENADDNGMIRIRGAHLHNLREVDVEIPRERLVAFTGISGSGKSSLAFGTLHGEAQRRYLESVAPFARRLIAGAVDPQVRSVEGLPPTVAMGQQRGGGTARSSVATITALSNTIRLLYSRAGEYPQGMELGPRGRLDSDAFSPNTPTGMCPVCHGLGVQHVPTEESMVPDPSLSIADGAIASWPGAWNGKNLRDICRELGIDIDLPWRELPEQTRQWVLFTDEHPVVTVHPVRGAHQVQLEYQGTFSSAASLLMRTLAETGSASMRARALRFVESRPCPECDGRRLTRAALSVTWAGEPIDRLQARPLDELLQLLEDRRAELDRRAEKGQRLGPGEEAEHLLLEDGCSTLRSVVDLGLGHLSLDRSSLSISPGEMQRLRLAVQLRSGLFGVVYVLDEPSAGLHPSEARQLMAVLRRLVGAGSSVCLVEHDMELVRGCDWVVDVGPRAGTQGGRILHSGPVDQLQDVAESATGRFLRASTPPEQIRGGPVRVSEQRLRLRGVRRNTLDGIDAEFPIGALTALTGVSGSGKSSLLDALADATAQHLEGSGVVDLEAGDPEEASEGSEAEQQRRPGTTVAAAEGLEEVRRLVRITQKPIGRTPRSDLATYTGLFDHVRALFADTPEARSRGWKAGRFSFNTTPGRCPHCQGQGQVEVELVFLPGSWTVCPVCHGTRYDDETLSVRWEGRTIAEILELTVAEALAVFAEEPSDEEAAHRPRSASQRRRVDAIRRPLEALGALGLGYLRLGQPATELSGGEAQRIKLASELHRTGRSRTLYLLDEPSTGLHPADAERLLRVLHGLARDGATVVMAEHRPEAIRTADHVIDLGPGAGRRGGTVVAAGTPQQVAADPDSVTGPWLRG
ncbi:excinuclease ABC subunit UvrA [Kocuria palustris]|uniref:excinuclease ABC subunit UvrA n=1 Tax=Kocuria palustris TaxID=71999 RepID=UPI0020446896|nr:excinuclease ABC subunit UvrA [Kocuria palustris]MCM3330947.1 excinuclease ABC subunit UvrA [Kocuria palustris]MCT1834035.1 excinuclease ABC subunit UvrA [Kocuria palustris]